MMPGLVPYAECQETIDIVSVEIAYAIMLFFGIGVFFLVSHRIIERLNIKNEKLKARLLNLCYYGSLIFGLAGLINYYFLTK